MFNNYRKMQELQSERETKHLMSSAVIRAEYFSLKDNVRKAD